MKLLISIPNEFEQHFKADRFEDSLHRLSADAHLLAGSYEQETAIMLIEAFKKAVRVPPHGRLIDADALIRELEITEEDDHNGATLLMAVFLEVLKSAPTVIDAEEE